MAAQLIVRNLDDEIVEALRKQAAKHGRSAEAEHRAILRAALCPEPKPSLKALILAMPNVGEDHDFEIDRSAAQRDVSF
jgi:plasmid stability protein